MPNYVRNRVTFDANIPESDFRTFLIAVTSPDKNRQQQCLPAKTESDSENLPDVINFNSRRFDFNNIIPMPPALGIESSTRTDVGVKLCKIIDDMPLICSRMAKKAIIWHQLFQSRTRENLKKEYQAYAKCLHPDVASKLSTEDAEESMKALNRLYNAGLSDTGMIQHPVSDKPVCQIILEKNMMEHEVGHVLRGMRAEKLDLSLPTAFSKFEATPSGAEFTKLGRLATDNLKKYKAATWYEWCRTHWGTKWNAMETEIYLEERKITFVTAWNEPTPIMQRMQTMFPNIGFIWEYANEDAGVDTGIWTFRPGDTGETHTEFENCSSDAYKLYQDLWNSDCIYQDSDGTYKHYDCDTCPNQC